MPGPYTYQSMPQGPSSTQPVYPGYTNYEAQDSGGVMGWLKEHLGDVLKFGGTAAAAYGQNQQNQASQANDARKFQYSEAANLADKLNRAPLADKGQYLAMNIKPPMPFQPRDYTQQSQGGLQALRGAPTGGAAEQLAANNMASANYRTGAGGYNTDVYKSLLESVSGGQFKSPQNTTTTNYGGKQYNPQEWSAFLNEHPEVAKFLGPPQGGTTPGNPTGPAGPASNPYGFSLPERPTLDQVYAAWNKVHPGQAPPSPTSGDLGRFWEEYRRSMQGGG